MFDSRAAGLASLVVALGCGPAGNASRSAVERPTPAAAAVGAMSGGTYSAVVREIEALDGTITPERWWQQHPGDSLAPFAIGAGGIYGQGGAAWCMTSERRWQDDAGRTIARTARFYAPAPAEPLGSLPTTVDPQRARTQCRLGLISVSVTAPSPASLATQADSLHAAFAARYGRPSDRGSAVRDYWGAAFWRAPLRWRSGPVTVVSAADSLPYSRVPLQAFAFGYLPVTGLDARGDGDPASDETVWLGSDTALSSEALRAGIASAGAPAELGAALQAATRRAAHVARGEGDAGTGEADSALAGALRRWLDATAGFPAQRRAAALLAADRAIVIGAPASDAGGSPADSGAAIRALTALGAEYVYSELGAAFEYSGNWLRAARALDPTGPVGELAFLVQMERGFGEPLCGGPHEGEWFRTVIAEGERYLAGSHDRGRMARVHLLVGDAYRDIVALANGAAADYVDAAKYRSEEPTARVRAADHYRAAITLSSGAAGGSARLRAWRQAWRLLAGLPPSDQLRFFCVYD